MKAVYLFVLSVLLSMAVQAQSWKLKLDSKVILSTVNENEAKNVVKLKSADLKKGKQLVLVYTEPEATKGWERTIALYDTTDKVLTTAKGQKLSISAAALAKYLTQSKTVKIYTASIPKDPALAARVRVRRVHLVTLTM